MFRGIGNRLLRDAIKARAEGRGQGVEIATNFEIEARAAAAAAVPSGTDFRGSLQDQARPHPADEDGQRTAQHVHHLRAGARDALAVGQQSRALLFRRLAAAAATAPIAARHWPNSS